MMNEPRVRVRQRHAGPGPHADVNDHATICPGKSTASATSQMQFPDFLAEHNAAWTTNDNSRLGCGGGAGKDACYDPTTSCGMRASAS